MNETTDNCIREIRKNSDIIQNYSKKMQENFRKSQKNLSFYSKLCYYVEVVFVTVIYGSWFQNK